MIHSDILIIGSGITGTAVARELSRYHASVTVLDKGCDIAEGATKANSGIVHAGYDALPGTRKAFYNVRGAAMFSSLCEALRIPYRKCGALVIGFNDQDQKTLSELLKRGITNGVRGLQLLSRKEVLSLEPSLNPEVLCALSVPESAVVSPYELAFALADDAAVNGVRFFFNCEVCRILQDENAGWIIKTVSGDVFSCKTFINCSGSGGAEIHNMIAGHSLRMIHRRGQYYLLDRSPDLPFHRTVFQCPSPMGKGVLVTPTVHGNLLIGPNAEDIDDPLDTSTTSEGLTYVLERAQRTWPGLSLRTNITNFSGIRAHLELDDFLVGSVPGTPGAYEAIGIESPGLSSAPAIASDLSLMVAGDMKLRRKETVVPYMGQPVSFLEMNDEERRKAVEENPQYGNIICRCETVTEAEIRQAVNRPVGARTIDGVKRRTRAGMGRCQGGFCSPRVARIIAEETGIPLSQVTKNGGSSRLLADSVAAFLKGAAQNDTAEN